MGTTPTSRLPSSLPRKTARFGYSLRRQSGVRQVSTRSISTESFVAISWYQLKLLRHRPEIASGPASSGLTSSARRTRSGRASKVGGTLAIGGTTVAGAIARGAGGRSGWPVATQGCGLKQRPLPQPREARLPAIELRAPSQADPDP